MQRSEEGRVLFVGSGPYRVSQEIRGNIFAHSCIAALEESGADFVVMDNDAAGVLVSDADGSAIITKPFDLRGIAEVIESVGPSIVWPVCAGKEVQGLLTQVLEEAGSGDLLPGGSSAYCAATNWQVFRGVAEKANVDVPFGSVASSIEAAAKVAGEVGFPVFLSASKPRGGGGARIAYNHEELAAQMARLLSWSLAQEVLVVRVYEKHPHCQVHLLRDSAGDVEVLGVVDVLGPLGMHIGNAALVFPGRGFPDKRIETMKDCAQKLADASNLVGYGAFHFGVDPEGRAYTVGMRTGFGAASYIVSLGLSLDLARAATEVALGAGAKAATSGVLRAAVTVVSAPRFDSELFPGASGALGPHKISTGRGVGMADSFSAAMLAAERSARRGRRFLLAEAFERAGGADAMGGLAGGRSSFMAETIAAILQGHTIEEVSAATGISRLYLEEMAGLARIYREAARAAGDKETEIAAALEAGFSAEEVAAAVGRQVEQQDAVVMRRDGKKGPAFVVCGPAAHGVGEADESDVILRGFCRAYLKKGHRLIFVGWGSQMPLDLYFATSEIHLGECPQALEGILAAGEEVTVYIDARSPSRAELAEAAVTAGAKLAGVSPEQLALMGDRKGLGRVLAEAGLVLKEGEEVATVEHAVRAVGAYGYPVLVKPKCAQAPDAVVYDEEQLRAAVAACAGGAVVERFLEDLVECAVVVLCDGEKAAAAAVVEVLEEAGISSADCAGVVPAFSVPERTLRDLGARAERFAQAAGIKGLLTVRLGLRYDVTYFLSAAAGGSREVPFAAFALEEDIVTAAARIFQGAPLKEAWPRKPAMSRKVFIRQPVFSFDRFPGADTVLGTEARSTGDVLGTGENFALAFAQARRAAGRALPSGGMVFVSLRDRDKRDGMILGRELKDAGFKVVATEGTARALAGAGVQARVVYRVSEGRPNAVDLIKNGEISLVIYTPAGRVPREDEVQIRTVAWGLGIPVITTLGEARAAVTAIEALKGR